MKSRERTVSRLHSQIRVYWPEWTMLAVFTALAVVAVVFPITYPRFSKEQYAPALSALLSIGTGGIVGITLYYVLSVRFERRRRQLIKGGVLQAYRLSKKSIAFSVIHASIKGGRADLVCDMDTVERILTVDGFKELFRGGKEAHEGFYAFENQMTEPTYEYRDIIFELEIVARNVDLLLYGMVAEEPHQYAYLMGLFERMKRIIHSGSGYEESKIFCRFI